MAQVDLLFHCSPNPWSKRLRVPGYGHPDLARKRATPAERQDPDKSRLTCKSSARSARRVCAPRRAITVVRHHQEYKPAKTEEVVAEAARDGFRQGLEMRQAHITKLYRNAGLHDCSSHSGTRTFAKRLAAKGHDIEIARSLLGHAKFDRTDDYLDVDPRTLKAMSEGAL